MTQNREVILKAEDLCRSFPVKSDKPWEKPKQIHAVDHVSFELYKGETIGVVGESGCGKSTMGQCILRLQKPDGGKVFFKGQDLSKCSEKEMRRLRGKMQIVFQDPYSSLDPTKTVEKIISEPLAAQAALGNYPKDRIKARVREMISLVGLEEASLNRYPHEFSGGQRQRIGIARAFACEPELIICDEAVSALDVSIQAQIINLLKDLKEKTGVSYLFISHDLSVVEHVSDRILVLYFGRIVEMADGNRLFERPLHPYTNMLLNSVPIADPNIKQAFDGYRGEVPGLLDRTQGCGFCSRCPYADEKCRTEVPVLKEAEAGHLCACHHAGEIR